MPSKTSKPKPAKYHLQFEAIGTQWQISSDQRLNANTVKLVRSTIALFDQNYSRFKADSWLRQISAQPGTYDMPADAQPLFDLYQKLYVLTDGAMTPLIGQTLSQAGYDENYSLRPSELTVLPSWNEAIGYDFPKVTIKRPVLLDLGAAGKGYLVDIIHEIMQAAGHNEFVINAGGDIRQCSQTNTMVHIGLEHPQRTDEVIGVADICNQSLCGSAGNRRRWASYNHIIDGHSLRPQSDIDAVWAIASNTMLADGLSTALYFSEPAKLLKDFDFEYAIMANDESLRYSKSFPANFFSS